MFDDLNGYTRVEHGVLKISQDGLIMVKGPKICGLYILYGSTAISYVSSNEDFHDKNKL